MPKQSTRHKYKTRREKNIEYRRVSRILFIGGSIFAVLMLLRNWERIWHFIKPWFAG